MGPSRSKRRKLNEQIDDDFEMPYQSLVLLHREDVEIGPNNAVGILNNSATFSKCRFSYEESQFLQGKEINFRCEVRIQDYPIAQAIGATKKETKEQAALSAVQFLKTANFTILIKDVLDRSQSEISIDSMLSHIQQHRRSSTQTLATGIGGKLLAKMGWKSGVGLGKNEQGIKEPITVQEVFRRQGLGAQAHGAVTEPFRRGVQAILAEYERSNSQHDLVFGADISKDQRAFVHKICSKRGLKSTSYGQGDNRQLTISRKRTALELLGYLLEAGGETPKYKVLYPTAFV